MKKGRITTLTTVMVMAAFIYAGIRPIEKSLEEHKGPKRTDKSVAIAWNKLAVEIAYVEDQFFTFKGHRAFSMMHLAMHDVLNSIEPRYQEYACSREQPDADPEAAAVQAAFEVLLSQYPDQKSTLEKERGVWLDRVPDSDSKQLGLELGRTCADTILKLREGDRWDAEGSYEYQDVLGNYQTTGSWDGFVLQPGFRSAKPFVLKAPDQFRPLPPPALDSKAYTEAFNEIKAFGAAESTIRSEDQAGYAVWWMEFAEGSVNRLARQLAEKSDLDLWNANRMFANINVALYDTYIAVWDAKYEYNHWRPVTAIRRADEDDNEQTTREMDWEPLRPTAPFPDYPSAHAAACAATFGVLEHIFGADFYFTMETKTAPEGMLTRSFGSIDVAAAECADSRIQLGWHFRYAADEGLVLGRRVAEYVISRELKRKKTSTATAYSDENEVAG